LFIVLLLKTKPEVTRLEKSFLLTSYTALLAILVQYFMNDSRTNCCAFNI